MREIKNVILCGLGAIGSVYADKLQQADCKFRVLVDTLRLERYKLNPIKYNGNLLNVNYILPNDSDFKADLIIIATKMSGLNFALDEIENFVGDNTIIISLINGVKSENLIAKKYGKEKVLYSYFIGHSAVRNGNNIFHDGVNKVVFGSDNPDDIEKVSAVKTFFDKIKINYEISKDIKRSLWIKFMLNVSANPITAMFRMTFGQMLNNKSAMNLAKQIMKEVQLIAKAEGVNNTETMIEETLEQLSTMSPQGRTSMLQDVEAGRQTEIDIFAGTVSELGKKHNIKTPYCDFLNDAFAVIQNQKEKGNDEIRK